VSEGRTALSVGNRRLLLTVAAIALVWMALPSLSMRAAPLPNTIAIEDMTWTEVRDARENGYTTVIVPTGGLEQNGPHMAIGKHNFIVREAADRIAKAVGRTLVAPVVAYVPQGTYDPPTGHLRFPGTMGVPETVFDGMLDGIARSLKAGGFKTICFIGDHGGSQPVQKAVAERLSAEWAKDGVRVLHIDGYYDDRQQIARLLKEGRSLETIGQHASLIDTSELMSINPKGVDLARYRELINSIRPSGVSGDPSGANADLGTSLFDMRVAAAVSQIKALQAQR
jgi:creatinine amidohydrolase/Fe(II)-dependent formamide hydrolase-like protein